MKILFANLSAWLVVIQFPLVVFAQLQEIELPESWSEPSFDETTSDPAVWSDLNEWYNEHPVCLPKATRSQLLELPGMDGLIADAILNYKLSPGFQSISDVSRIPEISSAYYIVVKNWLTMELPENSKKSLFQINSELRQRNRFKSGNEEKTALKSLYSYTRIKIKTNRGWMGGLITEKDKDESNFSDYLNGTIFYQSPSPYGWIVPYKFSAGSYQLAFGEGLLFSRAATMGKSSSVINSPIRNSNGLSPSLSSDENRYLFGSAGSILFPDAGFETGVFFSSRRYDGESEWISGFDENDNLHLMEDFKFDYSGLHTDSLSISKKDKLPVSIYGGWAEWSEGKFLTITGVTGIQKLGDVKSEKDNSIFQVQKPDRSERFTELEKKTSYFSVSAQVTLDFAILTAEFARFQSKKAFAGWLLSEPLPGFKYILHHRDADPGFTPLFGRPFADKMSSPGNETGWYHGLEISVNKYQFSFYRDEYRHPWPGYLQLYPSKGIEWFGGIEKRLRGDDNFKIQTRHSVEFGNGAGVDSNNQIKSNKTRVEWKTQVLPTIQLKFRVDLNESVKNFSGKGLTGQLKMKIKETGNFVFQATWFDAILYEDRIYVYESDLPGMMSFSPLYGEGVRFSFLAGNRFFNKVVLSGKVAIEHFSRINDGKKLKKTDALIGFQLDLIN